MAQTFFPITPTEITPGGTLSWRDMDASSLIASGATGVILHIVNNSSTKQFGVRKNGSTDDRRQRDIQSTSHAWAMIGVDGSRIFEVYTTSTTDVDFYVVGYTMSGVTFATNATNKNLSVSNAWEDMDCSTEAPSAIGLIFERIGEIQSNSMGLRKNGSTDDRNSYWVVEKSCFGGVIGCDGSQICEGYSTVHTQVDYWLVGYITDGATFITNATDLSLGSSGSYVNLAALPEGAIMGIIEVTAVDDNYGLREEGESGGHADIYVSAYSHPWAIVKCDASRIIEGKINDTGVDFWLVGYATEAVGWAGGDVNGVAIATIAKINGVALADIVKVNGVA